MTAHLGPLVRFRPALPSFGLVRRHPGLPDCGHGAASREVSRGLEQVLAEVAAVTPVIYEGPQAEVDRLAAAYGLTSSSGCKGGAVFSGRHLAVRALATTVPSGHCQRGRPRVRPEHHHDADDRRQPAVEGRQVGNFSGLIGKGIGIAVIDSGIANHPDLRTTACCTQWTSPVRARATATATARTWRASSPAAARRQPDAGRAALRGHGAGRALISLKVLGS